MSSSDAKQPAVGGQPAGERLGLRRRLGMWLSLVVMAAVVAALVSVLLIRGGAGITGGTTTSSQWQTYHDPLGLFTLWLPPGWAAQVEPATAWYGDPTTSPKVREDMIAFHDPSQETGSADVVVVADPIKTAFDRQYFCQANSQPPDFSPLTLTGMEHTGALAIFVTENAAFQIDVKIPGVLAPTTFGPPPPPATPIPARWVTADKTEVNTALVSFQPTDPKPLTC